jgi:16S rRNA (uracil1498-N3)-methyltransferase
VAAPTIYLPPDATAVPADSPWYRYLARVVRVRVGERLRVLDGFGGERDAVITDIDRQRLSFEVRAQRRLHVAEPLLILSPALIPSKRFDWIVEKATELGVDVIEPLVSERGEVPLRDRDLPDRLARWRRKADEAVRQCGRALAPEIRPPRRLDALLSGPPGALCLLASPEGDGASPALPERGVVRLLIGPEGGWSPAEQARAREAGVVPFRFARHVLRVETAALAGAAVLGRAMEQARGAPH